MQRPPMRALHFRLSADIILRNISGFWTCRVQYPVREYSIYIII
jgi:hypothetical protein